MLAGMSEYLDVIVPRGGRSLVERVQKEARVPVIGHLEGNCHVYIDRDADVRMTSEYEHRSSQRPRAIRGTGTAPVVGAINGRCNPHDQRYSRVTNPLA